MCVRGRRREREEGGIERWMRVDKEEGMETEDEEVVFLFCVHFSSQDIWFWRKMTHSKLCTFCHPSSQQPRKEHFVKLSSGAAESRSERSCDMLLHNSSSKNKFPWIIKSSDLLNLASCPETLRINSAGPNGASGYPTLYSPPPPLPCFSRNNPANTQGSDPKPKCERTRHAASDCSTDRQHETVRGKIFVSVCSHEYTNKIMADKVVLAGNQVISWLQETIKL